MHYHKMKRVRSDVRSHKEAMMVSFLKQLLAIALAASLVITIACGDDDDEADAGTDAGGDTDTDTDADADADRGDLDDFPADCIADHSPASSVWLSWS